MLVLNGNSLAQVDVVIPKYENRNTGSYYCTRKSGVVLPVVAVSDSQLVVNLRRMVATFNARRK